MFALHAAPQLQAVKNVRTKPLLVLFVLYAKMLTVYSSVRMLIKLVVLRLLSLVHKLGLVREPDNFHKSIAKVVKQDLMLQKET